LSSGVPEAAAFRVDLRASHRARRIRRLAQALTVIAAAACALAFVLVPSTPRFVAALASTLAMLLAFRPGREPSQPRLGVDAEGAVVAGTGESEEVAVVQFSSPAYVCLMTRSGRLALWPDSLPATAWRRLLVACRWGRQREGGGVPTAGSRTK
jgi:hypothetical protein